MIVGVGTDLLALNRIQRVFDRFPERFAARILSEEEQARLANVVSKVRVVRFLGMQFCAKESVSKALGTGMQNGVTFDQIVVGRNRLGQPTVTLNGAAQSRASQIGIDCWHLSLSDDSGFIQSVAIAESWSRS